MGHPASAGLVEAVGIQGYGVAVVTGPDGHVKQVEFFHNLITTVGDQYYSKMGIAGVSPANAAAPTKVSGMKLGTGTTAAGKSGAGALLGGYITGSNVSFAATYPQSIAVAGTDTGYYAAYQASWSAGVATNAAITEVVMVTDSGTDASSTASATIARALITSLNKAVADTLTIAWQHKMLGA